jgi:hypothetical protein
MRVAGESPGRCETCRWWEEEHEDTGGHCRRKPPVPVRNKEDDIWTVWPMTQRNGWCGEWYQEDLHVLEE